MGRDTLSLRGLKTELDAAIDTDSMLDMGGANQVTAVEITSAIAELAAHKADLANPHAVGKEQIVGLKLDESPTFAGLVINGDITQNGSAFITNAEQMNVEKNTVRLNEGETGAGITEGFGGIIIDRGTSEDYFLGFSESKMAVVVGEIAEETEAEVATCQVLATREDVPTDGGFSYWDTTAYMFKTKLLAISDVGGLQTALDAKVEVTAYETYKTTAATALSDGLATKSDTGHGHAIADTAGLQTALDAKVATTALDAYKVVVTNNLATGLATKSDTGHGHAMSEITGLIDELSTKASVSALNALVTRVDNDLPELAYGQAIFNGYTGTTISMGSPMGNYSVSIEAAADADGTIGEVWVEQLSNSQFVVKCTGTFVGAFTWMAMGDVYQAD